MPTFPQHRLYKRKAAEEVSAIGTVTSMLATAQAEHERSDKMATNILLNNFFSFSKSSRLFFVMSISVTITRIFIPDLLISFQIIYFILSF